MQGSFVKKRGNTWTAYFYVADLGGKRRQRSKGGFKTKRLAQAWLAETVGSVQTREFIEKQKLTVEEYLTGRWLPIMRSSLKPTTFDSYQRLVEWHVLPYLGELPLQELSADHLDRLYAHLLEDGRRDGKSGGLSKKTVRSIHNLLHKALRDAERKRLVSRNVTEAADAPKLPPSGEDMTTWTASELRTFLEAVESHRLYAALLLAATTGMRRGEVLGLRWSDIDFQRRRLAVRQTITTANYRIVVGTPKTRRGRRSIALDQTTLQVLAAHQERQLEERRLIGAAYSDQGLVFPREDGTPINPDLLSQVFDRAVAKLSIPRIRFHDLRHTHATLGLAAGVPAKVMSERLGHATVAFTLDIYTHAVPGLDEASADQMGELIFGTGDSSKPVPIDRKRRMFYNEELA